MFRNGTQNPATRLKQNLWIVLFRKKLASSPMWANVFYKWFSDRYFLTLKKKGPIKLWCGGTNMRCGWDPVQIFAAPVDTSSLLSHCTVGMDQEAISKICK